MSNGELNETPKALVTPEAKVESRESKESMETQGTPERQSPVALEAPVERPPQDISFGPPTAAAPKPVKDAHLMKVERILEENLGDVYFGMPAGDRLKFKAKGEETAVTLRGMIEAGKASARNILALIKEWLRIIPGVNKFYLEQEAKIKTDRIMQMVDERKREKELQV
jgi:hypothetical protein